jgi:hypothetical protein
MVIVMREAPSQLWLKTEGSQSMKRSRFLGALLWPISALAHGSEAVFYLLWWHVALILWVLCFLVFSSVNKRRKFCAILGFVLVPVVVWSVLGSVSSGVDAWLDMALTVAIGAAPLIGFLMGLYLTRSKSHAT